MSYQEAMEIAGATVHDFEIFGSYQGEWWAFLTYEGRTGFVHGGYGSCSWCDAFEGTSWEHEHSHEGEGYQNVGPYDLSHFKDDCEECRLFREEMASFGRDYLGEIATFDEALKCACESWEDRDGAEKFVRKHGAPA